MEYTKKQLQRQRELWEAIAQPPGEVDDGGNLLSDRKEPQTSREHAQALREMCEALANGHYDHARHQKVLEDAANHLDAQGDDTQPMESRRPRRLQNVTLNHVERGALGGRRPQALTEARLAAARKVFDGFEEAGGAGETRRREGAWKHFSV